jgi:acetyl-CoA acetyltransferase
MTGPDPAPSGAVPSGAVPSGAVTSRAVASRAVASRAAVSRAVTSRAAASRPAGSPLNGSCAIAGIGATEFSKDSGRSELRLAVEAVRAALDDAGLPPGDVSGLVTFGMDNNPEIAVARELGMGDLRFLSRIGYGGGAACAVVQQAVLAVSAGIADVVVCYRAMNERSGRRFGRAVAPPDVDGGWHYPMGLATPAAMVAMVARRYLHDYGATADDFGRVAVAMRRHAATNPYAWFHGRPITLDEHRASRWIAEPLRLLDCCQESDGAVALVVTSVARARDLARRPAVVRAAAQGSGPGQFVMTSYYRPSIAALPEMGVVAGQLWEQSGFAPADVRTAVLYDHFTPYVLMQLEDLGFCARGEAAGFVADGGIEIDGRLPVNPHGGQLGEAYIHGMNGIAEAVRQVRGTAVNQVPGDGPVLVTAGTGVPTSGLVLSALSA